MKARVNLYAPIHKAQRGRLFALAVRAGRADWAHPDEVAAIKKELAFLIAHLREHSEHEKMFIHPLFKEIGNEAELLDEEHGDLEEMLEELEQLAKEERWEELYPELNRFIASYLDHQDEEELAQEEVLWPNFDDARLQEVMVAFKKSRTPQLMMADLELMVPYLDMQELKRIFGGMKATAPAETFEAACKIGRAGLEPARWADIEKEMIASPKI